MGGAGVGTAVDIEEAAEGVGSASNATQFVETWKLRSDA